MAQDIVVTFHELVAEAQPLTQGGVQPQVNLSILHLFNLIKDNELYKIKYPYLNQSHYGRLNIIEIDPNGDRIDILYSVCDVKADPSCIENVETDEARIEERDEDEGLTNRVSISIKIDPNNKDKAIFGIERKNNVTPKSFISTLDFLMRQARAKEELETEFHGNHPTLTMSKDGKYRKKGQPRVVEFKVKFKYETQLSEEIVKAFEKGKVSDISFFLPEQKKTKFDNKGYFEKSGVDVHIKPTVKKIIPANASPFQKAKALKQNLFDMADKPNMRSLTFKIVFKDELGDNRTAYYDAAERELSLSKRLKFSKDLRQAVTKTPILNQALCDNIYRKLLS